MTEFVIVSAFVVLALAVAGLRLLARMGQARDEAVEDANKLSE